MSNIVLMMELEGSDPIYRATDRTDVIDCKIDIEKFVDDKWQRITQSGYNYNVFLITGSRANEIDFTDEDMVAFDVLIKQSKFKKENKNAHLSCKYYRQVDTQ